MLLVQAAIPFPAHCSVYDPNPNCSAAYFTQSFTQGTFDDYDALMAFGQQCDVVIYENEQINLDALFDLQKAGVRVLSSPDSLAWIQDKGIQRDKLKEAGFPSPDYALYAADELQNYSGPFPVVQKWRTGGYDGKGVSIIKNSAELATAAAQDSVLEACIDIDKELSSLVARNEVGDIAIYPATEMVFDPELNLVDYLIAPARIEKSVADQLEDITREMAEKLNFVGVYAIEFFLDKNGELFVNEVSPRTHNSGHHTVAANHASQYEQQIRIALGLPLGSTETLSPCVMANLLADDSTGTTQYHGLEAAYQIP